MKISSYSHATPGRLRIKIHQVKGSQENARRVELVLRNIGGVNSVRANPLTGNALVFFDSDSLAHGDVIEILVRHGYLQRKANNPRRSQQTLRNQILNPEYISKTVADIVLQTVVEFAVKRALLALV